MNHSNESQEEVFAFLADPVTHGGAQVERVETHADVLFLTPKRVFKVKRAVQFPFLDFSTLDKRKAACDSEIQVNRRYAPQLYRGVIAITRDAGARLSLGGDGAPVEWAVEMVRFDESQTLDHLADAGKIDAALAERLGDVVADVHRLAPCRPQGRWATVGEPDAPSVPYQQWIAALGSYVEEHEKAFDETAEVFPPAETQRLANAGRLAFADLIPLLIKRGELGFIRRIHGDLHLGNIVLIDGWPVAFDAIEFNDLIGTGDELYDLAFLLMDLVERGLGSAANIVLNSYLAALWRRENFDALRALPLYLSLRAQIRARVTAARLAQVTAEERPPIAASARKYFDWAWRFINPEPPRLIAIGGLSGTGKSVLARALAPEIAPLPGAVVLRSDVERKFMFNKRPTERLPAETYTPEATERVYAEICDKARRAVAAGHSAIIDAVFAQQRERDLAAAAAGSAPFHGLFLTTALATRIERVASRRNDASDADAAVAHAQERFDVRPTGWTQIDASGLPAQTLARARKAISP